MKRLKKLYHLISFALITSPAFALADTLVERSGSGSLRGFFMNIADIILSLTAALGTLFVVIGGIKLVTSAGNPEKLEGAKKTLLYAVIGLALAVFSLIIIKFIQNQAGGIVLPGKTNYTP